MRRVAVWVLALMVGVLIALGLAASVVPKLQAGRAGLNRAKTDIQSARQALAAKDLPGARAALDRAARNLQQASQAGRGTAAAILRPVPLVGSPLKALRAATRAGQEGVTAGRILSDAIDHFPTSGHTAVDGFNLAGFHGATETGAKAVEEADHHLVAARQALQGPAGALLPQISGPAREMLAMLDEAHRQLAAGARGLGLFADLTAADTDARLLILSQDSMELRATGGFVGSYGVLHFKGGTAKLEQYTDAGDLHLPDPPMTAPKELANAVGSAWELTNVNWWPDFPTTARTAVEMFRRQGGGDVVGVIAITEHVMQDLVAALGPVKLPSYAQPVTADGFAQRVLYEVELKQPHDEPRKKFLVELADTVFGHLFSLAPDQVPSVVSALGRAAGAGDLQVYFGAPDRQAAVAGTTLEGALPKVSGDFLMTVETNMSAGKANAELVRDIHYTVAPGPDGRRRATLRIEYRDTGAVTEVNPYYNGYLRVYVPRGSTLIEHGDLTTQAEDAPDGPYGVFSKAVYVPAGGERVVETFEYLLPESAVDNGHYRLTWLRQSGTNADTLTATIGDRVFTAVADQRRLDIDAKAP